MDIDKATILQAWKDDEFAASLSPELREQIPARPVSLDGSELTDEQLEQAAGGLTPAVFVAGATSAVASAKIASQFD